ncbi:putative enoyl-CoA hydratase echA8 [Corynebacterium occultum]|uniref:3-hydroxyisobutyryl-CoA hydrolase n=1 Tax=Corynebacterium occultum TaxID=2675219 RepID=A0A6B8W659_9CORY|nr:enoyl-CoA hydratase/isomerase family protein [Corynebacterium occultum]QGU06795.1 putative enoyl-CoA hydratase echA8 [Corynebacterium occultum]
MTENVAKPATEVDPEVRSYIRGNTGVLELNRPRAINSLNPEMIAEISRALKFWETDEAVTQVLLYSNSERGFCAGGDVRFARSEILAGNEGVVDEFFRAEYELNHFIANYPKPYVSLIDGVVMGGGWGISLHGSHRIITERAFAAMPEMAIGYFTDVGVAYASQRMVGEKGKASPALAAFIGLSGARLNPADLIWSGVATHVIFSKNLQNFMDAMIDRGIAAALTENATTPPRDSEWSSHEDAIEECFAQDSWAEIETALQAHPDTEFRSKVRELMAVSSPTSVVATAEFFRACRSAATLREALGLEIILGEMLRREPDFVEGVRAVLVDKDRSPSFSPASTAEVDVEKYRSLLT